MSDLTKDFKFDLQLFAEGEGEGGGEGTNKPGEPKPPEGGEEWPKWLSQGPDKYKENESFKGMPNIGDLQDSYLALVEDKKASIKVPGKDATEEEIHAYWNALGRPEKSEDYKFEETQFPEGLPKSEELEKSYTQLAHALGLTNPQAEGLYKFYNDIMINAFNEQKKAKEGAQEAVEKAATEADEALRKEWGKDYDANKELMKRAMMQFGGEGFGALMDSSELGNNPTIIKAFVNIGKKMGEGEFIEGKPSPGKAQTEEEKAKEMYPDMAKDGIPYRQEIVPKEEPDEDLKEMYPDMNLENL